MPQQQSYCLDVRVGYDSRYVEELVEFLRRTGAPFGVTKGRRGRMDGVKILRVHTSNAEELIKHIENGVRTGDDNEYEIHYSAIDARRCMNFLPDYDSPLGHKEFDIIPATETTNP